MQVADHRPVGVREDRRLRVVVDRADPLGALAAGDVLRRAADPARDVEVGADLRAGLPDLVGVGPPAGARRDARAADRRAEQSRELLDDREALRRADAALARTWRLALRGALTAAFDAGYEMSGATRDGWYVLEQDTVLIGIVGSRIVATSSNFATSRGPAPSVLASWSAITRPVSGTVQMAAGPARYSAIPVQVRGRPARGVFVAAVLVGQQQAGVENVTRLQIEVGAIGDVHRAKLYYLRDLRGKKAKIKERRETTARS